MVPGEVSSPEKMQCPTKNLLVLTQFLQYTHHVFKTALARRNLPSKAFCDVGNCPSFIIVLLAVKTSTDQKKSGLVRMKAGRSNHGPVMHRDMGAMSEQPDLLPVRVVKYKLDCASVVFLAT